MKRVSPALFFQIRFCLALSLTLLIVVPINTIAHRSGCHRWRNCPSDSGSYICGDTGHCSQCPDNQYCEGGEPQVIKPAASSASVPVVQAQATIQIGDVIRIDHEGFTIWLDCARRGAVKFCYNAHVIRAISNAISGFISIQMSQSVVSKHPPALTNTLDKAMIADTLSLPIISTTQRKSSSRAIT